MWLNEYEIRLWTGERLRELRREAEHPRLVQVARRSYGSLEKGGRSRGHVPIRGLVKRWVLSVTRDADRGAHSARPGV